MNKKGVVLTEGVVLSRKKIANDIYHIKIRLEKSLGDYEYGNFVMIHLKDTLKNILPRPFSIFKANDNNLELIFKEVGEGTKVLATKDLPFSVKVWGPLGNSFPYSEDIVFVAGGLGLVPIYQKIAKCSFRKAFVGFKNISEAYFLDCLRKKKVVVTTDDGSYGEKGFVTDLFRKFLEKEAFKGTVVSCGPQGLLKSLWTLSKEFEGFEIYGSFETYMACGIGVCLGCAIETPRGMLKVCKDGPVFNLKDVFGA
jgi:dihydroorotate dehydrogenase electron transfer subunit